MFMPKTKAKNQKSSVDDTFLLELPPTAQACTHKINAWLMQHIAGVTKKANQGWKGYAFHHPQAGYLLGVFPFADHVRVLFEWGVLLPDPDQLLQGDGKRVRFFDLAIGADIPQQSLIPLIQAAIELRRKK